MRRLLFPGFDETALCLQLSRLPALSPQSTGSASADSVTGLHVADVSGSSLAPNSRVFTATSASVGLCGGSLKLQSLPLRGDDLGSTAEFDRARHGTETIIDVLDISVHPSHVDSYGDTRH
jgi:hypothetical protein